MGVCMLVFAGERLSRSGVSTPDDSSTVTLQCEGGNFKKDKFTACHRDPRHNRPRHHLHFWRSKNPSLTLHTISNSSEEKPGGKNLLFFSSPAASLQSRPQHFSCRRTHTHTDVVQTSLDF